VCLQGGSGTFLYTHTRTRTRVHWLCHLRCTFMDFTALLLILALSFGVINALLLLFWRASIPSCKCVPGGRPTWSATHFEHPCTQSYVSPSSSPRARASCTHSLTPTINRLSLSCVVFERKKQQQCQCQECGHISHCCTDDAKQWATIVKSLPPLTCRPPPPVYYQ
jgi:hypothetical protein